MFLFDVARFLAEAHSARLPLTARIRGHNDNGVCKTDRTPVGVVGLALIENLQQDVHDIRVRFFDLIKQNDGIGFPAHLFGKLPCLIIADVAGRRADKPRYRMLFHKFRHIQANERFRRIKQFTGKQLNKLGLAHARGAHENKGCGTLLHRKLDAAAADRRRNKIDRLILPDKMCFQAILHADQAFDVALHDLGRRNARPKVDDARQVLLGHKIVACLFAQGGFFLFAGKKFGTHKRERGVAFVFLLFVIFGLRRSDELLFAGLQLRFMAQKQLVIADCLIAEVRTGTRFVQQVDRLIGQEAVGDIALGERHRLMHERIGNAHAVVIFVIAFDP